jgi:membrane-bound lytic murein transglycosylase F
LLATSVGIGFYFFTKINYPKINNYRNNNIIILQNDIDENIEVASVLLHLHASDYFFYRGIPIGFQYEMLKELEKELGISIELEIETEAKNIPIEVYLGKYDIAIMDLHLSEFLLPLFERSIPHSRSYPVLVTGNKKNSAKVQQIVVSSDFFAKCFFNADSPYHDYPIQIINDYSTEELFEQVDNGEILYLICDYNQAITLIPFYSNVQILEKAGPQFERRWILNKRNLKLNEKINHWLLDFKKTRKYRWLLRKYFTPESKLITTSFAKKHKKGISEYDEIIKKYAQQYGFDWRFVASIICQESKFIAGLTGKGESYGLMHLMPVTMEYYGISGDFGEDANILAGVKHLNSIRKDFDDIDDEEEKRFFIAASYNAGRGHIFDAQRLCAKNEEDPKKWKNVSKYLRMKSNRDVVANPAVKSGFYPGSHTVKYTQQVMNRYNAYKATYPE